MLFQWKLLGARDVEGRFTEATEEAQKQQRELARESGRLIVKEMKKEAPVGTHYKIQADGTVTAFRPETLKKSIKFRTFARSWGTEIRVYAAKHALYVINKTRAHWIRAKKAKVLRFFWPNAPRAVVERFGGNVVFFKQIWHPGTASNPFHFRALLSLEPQFHHMLNKFAVRFKEFIEG